MSLRPNPPVGGLAANRLPLDSKKEAQGRSRGYGVRRGVEGGGLGQWITDGTTRRGRIGRRVLSASVSARAVLVATPMSSDVIASIKNRKKSSGGATSTRASGTSVPPITTSA